MCTYITQNHFCMRHNFFPVESKYRLHYFVHRYAVYYDTQRQLCRGAQERNIMTKNNVSKIRKTVLDLRKTLIYTVVNTKKS